MIPLSPRNQPPSTALNLSIGIFFYHIICYNMYRDERNELHMSCYFIVHVYIDDASMRAPYDDYILKVKPIVESYGGEYLVRTEKLQASSESCNPDRLIIVRFKDRQTLDRCFASKEYAEIMDLRAKTVKTNTIIAEGV